MYFYKFKSIFIHLFSILLLCILFCGVYKTDVYALEIADFSYEITYNALPKEYQDSKYCYKSGDTGLLVFATYNGNDYRTSIKKKQGINDVLYCINQKRMIEFTDSYELDQNMFNDELRTRLAIAFYYGPKVWGEKAGGSFSTGNFVLDYYMTQLVVHSLIGAYGGEKADMGIDYSTVKFQDGCDTLETKTNEFYKFCCDAVVKYDNGNFQSADFDMKEPADTRMFVEGDYLVSDLITCDINADNATVASYSREVSSYIFANTDIIIEETATTYDSAFRVKIPLSILDALYPSDFSLSVAERVAFNRKKAGLWQCIAEDYIDTSQEVGGMIEKEKVVSDKVDLNLVVGSISLYKEDAITNEVISDAQFEIQQYNETTGQYEFYKKMSYNTETRRYESGHLYLNNTNRNGLFRVIETVAGKNYQLDWQGQEFVISKDCYLYEYFVENTPILGKLSVTKTGEKWNFNDNKWNKSSSIRLPKVSFSLYAKEDIYIQNKLFYQKDKKIIDLITNQNGQASISDLPVGKYYIKETHTLNDYILDEGNYEFEITRDENRKYSNADIKIHNKLKRSQIAIFKCYYDEDDEEQKKPIPISNVCFGLYTKEDICDALGNVILKKDTCISKKYTDKHGKIVFEGLPYNSFYVKELSAPDGFALNDGIVPCDLKDFQYNKELGVYVLDKTIVNQRQHFSLSLTKTAEVFSGFEKVSSPYGEYHVYQIGKDTLQDVSFSLFDSAKKLLLTKKTDDKGIVSFKDLLPGTYYVSESLAPAEYVKVDDQRKIQFSMSAKEYNVLAPPVLNEDYFDELCECKIELNKLGEQVYVENDSLSYRNIPLANVIFGIYQDFDYTFSEEKTVLPKGSCVGYIVTDVNGKGQFSGKLPCGKYYLKELKALERYNIDNNTYYFDVIPNNNETIFVRVNDANNTFYNMLSKSGVKIVKIDAETEEPLKNVEFTLYNQNNEKIGVYKTDSNGEILVENLPYGEYYFVETKAKKGYYSTNNKFQFVLNSSDYAQLRIKNSPVIRLGIDDSFEKVASVIIISCLGVFLLVSISCLKGREQLMDKKDNDE